MSERDLTGADLVEALLDKARYGGNGDLGQWADQRYEVLREALDVRLDPWSDDEDLFDGQLLLRLLRKVITTSSTRVDPFADYLEAPRVVNELYQLHSGAFKKLEHQLREASRELVHDIYRLLVPGFDRRRTTESELAARGLSRRPVVDLWDAW